MECCESNPICPDSGRRVLDILTYSHRILRKYSNIPRFGGTSTRYSHRIMRKSPDIPRFGETSTRYPYRNVRNPRYASMFPCFPCSYVPIFENLKNLETWNVTTWNVKTLELGTWGKWRRGEWQNTYHLGNWTRRNLGTWQELATWKREAFVFPSFHVFMLFGCLISFTMFTHHSGFPVVQFHIKLPNPVFPNSDAFTFPCSHVFKSPSFNSVTFTHSRFQILSVQTFPFPSLSNLLRP